ncbi:MAG: tryptophan synthase subunit alpha [Chitinophagaceae bacterium]|nr:MAG: tryptophan synthase subunit alpha [Chitinophagaceae bacterium]
MNRLDILFKSKPANVLNIYCTAGFPNIDSTPQVMLALQQAGADIIEIGIPYSDPIADGPVIQQSNMQALENGMTIDLLFTQLLSVKDQLTVPVILMGYVNPVLQYGVDKFCEAAAEAGVSGVILPDLPMYEYEQLYKAVFEKHGLHSIFLISPVTSKQRIKKADELSNGFLYAVSSSSTTGSVNRSEDKAGYFNKIKHMNLRNPVLIGFGIKDNESFNQAAAHAAGAIIGTAYIQQIANSTDIYASTSQFLAAILGK